MFRRLFLLFVIVVLCACNRADINDPPVIVMDVFPYAGDSLTPFHIDLSRSSDAEDLAENLLMEFDWDNDGIWDTLIQGIQPIVHSFSGGGLHHIKAQITDRDGLSSNTADSLYIFPKTIYGELSDPRDGRVYKTVFLADRWWMAEHLKYGQVIDTAYDPTDNSIAEYYLPGNNPDNFEKYGGLYSWHETMNYNYVEGSQGVCPPGWHIPSSLDWDLLGAGIPTIFLSYYYGPDGPGGLNMQTAGNFTIYTQLDSIADQRILSPPGHFASFWTSSFGETKFRTASGFEATREFRSWLILDSYYNSVNDQLQENFRSAVDIHHIKGNKYLGIPNAYTYFYSAKSVRCIKNDD